MKLISGTWSNFVQHFNKYIGVLLLKTTRDKTTDALIKSIKLHIHLLESTDLSKLNTGWNSTNKPIMSPNHNVLEDVGDLAKFISQIKKFDSKKFDNPQLFSSFLASSSNKINVTKYYLDKDNNSLDVEIYTKKITQHAGDILSIYEQELANVETQTSYKVTIINKVLSELRTTLESLSSMK